ncbi:MAG: hypothetical protein ACREM1_05675 [Longimicrobiales bacterium]
MTEPFMRPPKEGRALVDDAFLESRNRALELAAFLDRLDRAGGATPESDYRVRAFYECLDVLRSREPGRVERVHMILSDPTVKPLETTDQKNANGAYDHWRQAVPVSVEGA